VSGAILSGSPASAARPLSSAVSLVTGMLLLLVIGSSSVIGMRRRRS
jgi:hypothetical protein